jgi:glycerol-3-phosphate dehydrogenase (NAD(P)+)
VVSLVKGIEQDTRMRMSEILHDEGDIDPRRVAVVSGPNLAKEIARKQPAASVVACSDEATARRLQQIFMAPHFRVYTNPDVVGVELAGCIKNVIAIAAGIADGLGFGDNAKASLMTRGLAELARLGVAMGGNALTFAGLAGMGDLVATCTSDKSRNRTVGVALGQGRALDEIVAEMKMVAEGVKSTAAVLELAARHDVELPIAEQVGAVLYEGRKPEEIVPALMLRQAKPELGGMRPA